MLASPDAAPWGRLVFVRPLWRACLVRADSRVTLSFAEEREERKGKERLSSCLLPFRECGHCPEYREALLPSLPVRVYMRLCYNRERERLNYTSGHALGTPMETNWSHQPNKKKGEQRGRKAPHSNWPNSPELKKECQSVRHNNVRLRGTPLACATKKKKESTSSHSPRAFPYVWRTLSLTGLPSLSGSDY